MRELGKLVENLVKDALAQACMSQGIDKKEVGWAVGGGGAIGPQVVRDPETGESAIVGFAPTWQITVSAQHRIPGAEPVAGSLPIYNVLPTKAEVDLVVTRLLSDVLEIREKQFTGQAPPPQRQGGEQRSPGGLIV